MTDISNAAAHSSLSPTIRSWFGVIQSLAVLLLLVLVLSILSPRFMTWINISNLMAQMSVLLVVATGMTIVMIAGEIDISVGSVVALTAAVTASVMVVYGIFPALLAGIATGICLGLFNGLLVSSFGIPSIIVTLATTMMARSLAFVLTGGNVITDLPPAFLVAGQGKLLDVLGLTDVIGIKYLNIPLSFLIALAVYFLGWFLTARMAFGRKVFAVGANRNVAMLSGIHVGRTKVICLVIVAVTAAIGGILLLSRIGGIQADTGRGLEFEVIAAVVIGGTSLAGGSGNVLRTLVGVLIIVLIRNFLNLSSIDIFWQDFATGGIIILAVLMDTFQKRMSRAS